ncbi:MAG: phage head morphogenesis protein, partial [Desulfobacterales bacterium]|nr:phage head morphogenesis protein [Desulfobacterales bacterium]
KTADLIKEINKPTFQEINDLVRKELVGIATGETLFVSGLITSSLPVVWEPVLPTARELRGIVFARPFENEVLAQWLARYQANDRRRMMDEIRQGLVFSETPTQIARRIFGTTAMNGSDGVREITRRGAQTLAQTAVSAISNASRQEVYKKNARVISREVYVATLDSRTTPICRSLDNDVFPVGEGPIPPLHKNCRSLRAPVVDGRKLGSRPATTATKDQLAGLKGPQRRREVAKLTGRVPADESYTTWLRKQNAGFQDEVLGPTRGRLFRKGELDLKGFVDNSGEQWTLRQLYEQDPGRFQRANLPAPRRRDAPVPKL